MGIESLLSYMPDFAGDYRQGVDWARKNRAQDQAEQRRNTLEGLAMRMMQGDPQATNQAYAMNPDYAGKVEEGAVGQVKMLRNGAKMIKQAPTPEARGMIYRNVLPRLRAQGVATDLPDDWDDSMLPMVDNLLAQTSYVEEADADNRRANWQRGPGNTVFNVNDGQFRTPDQTMLNSGTSPSGTGQRSNWQIKMVPKRDGTQQQMMYNPATGEWRMPEYGGAPSPADIPMTTPDDPAIAADLATLPPDQRERARQAIASGGDYAFNIQGGRMVPGLSDGASLPTGKYADWGVKPAPAPRQTNTRTKPGATPANDGAPPSGPPPMNPGELKKVRDDYKGILDAEGDFRSLQSALSEVGKAGTFTGTGGGKLQTAYANARAALRLLYNTGVLQPGELPMLNEALQNPTDWASIADPRSRERIAAQLQELFSLAERRKTQMRQTYPELGQYYGDLPTGPLDPELKRAMEMYGGRQ